MPKNRKHEWTAQLVPYGELAPNSNHPHFDKTTKQRLDLTVANMKSPLVGWLQQHSGLVLKAGKLAVELSLV